MTNILYNTFRNGPVVQLVRTLEVDGSSPFRVAIFADMAQVVEHILGKDEVTGSSPVISSKDRDAYHLCLFLFIG